MKREKHMSNNEYYNPKTFTLSLIEDMYIMVIREDCAKYIQDYLTTKYQIPLYTTRMMFQGLTGFPISKRLDNEFKVKLHLL